MEPYLITDTHRGIYFGELEGYNGEAVVKLRNARHCFSYTTPEGHEGTYGLATYGPGNGSLIGPTVTEMWVRDVATAVPCSKDAATRWVKATWI